MVVYFYIGICAIFGFVTAKKGKKFAIILIIVLLLVFSSFAPQIISFIGVFVNNINYKAVNSKNADT